MLILFIIFGLVIGSFLTVCIYRIPFGRHEYLQEYGEAPPAHDPVQSAKTEEAAAPVVDEKELTLIYPARSFCPSCKGSLPWYHNIPLFSWLALGGKCGLCKAKISVRYPVVELLSALCAAVAYQLYGFSPTAILVFAFCAALICISFIDYDYYIIPNVISYPGTALGLIFAAVNEWWHVFSWPMASGVLSSLLGLLAGAGFLYAVSYCYFAVRRRDGLGLGDVKLLAMTGTFFGPEATLYTIFMGSLLGSVGGGLIMLFFRHSLSKPFPFGPYLALATFSYIIWGVEPAFMVLEFIGKLVHG